MSTLKRSASFLVETGIWLAVLLMPWQARWIFHEQLIAGAPYEYGVMSLYAGSLLAVGAATVLIARAQRAGRMHLQKSVVILGLALVGWLAVAPVASLEPLNGWYGVFTLMVAGSYGVIALLWCRDKLVLAAVISGCAHAFIAWHQFILQRVPANALLGVAEHLPSVLGQSVVVIEGGRFLRAYGLMPHPNIFGGLMATAFLFAAYRFASRHSDTARLSGRLSWGTNFAAVLLLFSGVLISFSRSALIALACALAAWLCFEMIRRRSAWLRLAQVTAACCALFVVYNIVASGAWTQRLVAIVNPAALPFQERILEVRSLEERSSAYQEALRLVTPSRLVTGIGIGNYVPLLASVYPGRPVYEYQPVHNALLVALLELGVVGVLLILLAMASIRQYRGQSVDKRIDAGRWVPCVALIVIGLLDHYLWTTYAGLTATWLVVGWVAHGNKKRPSGVLP